MANEYRHFWMHFFKGLDAPGISGEVMVNSAFRDESTPSMSINLDTGLWKDFGDESIGAKQKTDGTYSGGGGDAIRFVEELYEIPFPVASKIVEEVMAGTDPLLPITHDLVMQYHKGLLENEKILNTYLEKRGLTQETVEKFFIGFDPKMNRITIPIMGAYGYWVNFRKYSLDSKAQHKMINHARKKGEGGYGHARLFPIRNLFKSNKIVLFEGEHDALLAIQMGINAITSTGGASVFPKDAEKWFYGKTVYLCYDNDHQGRAGMKKVARKLFGIADAIYMCPKLPLESPDNADFTDFIKAGYTRDDFAELVLKQAVLFTNADDDTAEEVELKDDDFRQVSLAQSLDPGYQNKPVKVDALVVGKGKAPYTIEKSIKFTCNKMNPDAQKCQSCGIFANNGKLAIHLPPHSSDTLLFVKSHNTAKYKAIKQMAKIPRVCDLFDMEVEEWQNVEELMIAPQVQTAKAPGAVSSDAHFHQSAFHIYPTNTTRIDTNRSYELKGIRATDPWEQHTTYLILEANPLQSNIETFKLTDDLKERLKVFQVKPGQSIQDKFNEIHADIEYNVTRIFGRRDLMTVYDLVYHSVLRFIFQHRVEHKGWLEALVIGDTRTGKSETAQWLAYHYNAGEYGAGEGATLAGLLGGLQQGSGGSNWMLTWGKIPLNDRGLFTVDEVSGLPIEHIGQLSGIRSMGVAELTKIRQEKTNARTRLIWISNPRKGKSLAEFEFGCEAIAALIGANEDIARFDIAVTAASGEVPEDEINRDIADRKPVPQVYTSELCNALIMWAWSRNLGNIHKNNQVVFTKEAEQAILHYATEFGHIYSSKIPLVEGANHRIKIAKMAAAAAVRVFSTDESCEKVIVKKEHVDFVAKVQMDAYDKPSMGYRDFSKKAHKESHMTDKITNEARQYLLAYRELLDSMKLMRTFSFRQLQEMSGYEPDILREHIYWLAERAVVRGKTNGQWTITPNGLALLKSIEKEDAE